MGWLINLNGFLFALSKNNDASTIIRRGKDNSIYGLKNRAASLQ